jgi:HAMP domain-containing protein
MVLEIYKTGWTCRLSNLLTFHIAGEENEMKIKIIIPNLVLVCVLGAGMYIYLALSAQRESVLALEERLKSEAALFVRSEALSGYEQLGGLTRLSMSREVTSLFRELTLTQAPDEDSAAYDARLREVWFKKALKSVETVTARLESSGRAPSLVFITDRNGVVLARNTTPNACPAGKNVAHAMTVVERALDGESGYTVWAVNDSPFNNDDSRSDHVCALMNAGLMETAAVPIWGPGDHVAGALVVGYEVSNGVTAEKALALGVDLAIVQGGTVYTSSFSEDRDREQLTDVLDDAGTSGKIELVQDGKGKADAFNLSINGVRYLAFPARVMHAARGQELAFVFLASLKEHSLWHVVRTPVLLFLLLAAFGVVVVGIILSDHFMKPVIEIEEGVLRIINGDTDYRFDVVSDEVGGLSYRINQLVNVLTDRDENGGDDS